MKNSLEYNQYPPIIQEFISYKSVIQGCSEKTVGEYVLDLKIFFKFLIATRCGISTEGEDFEKVSIDSVDLDMVKSVKTEDIYAFLMYATNTRNNQNASKARKLSSIKAFYRYLVAKRHYFDENPAINIESPKQRKSLPKYLSLDESLLLLEAVKNDKESKTTTRDYAIVTLFLNCGMRLSELVGINLNDIDRDLRSLRVVGKGNKERVIYLNEACRDALRPHIAERLEMEQSTKVNTNALFLSRLEKRISEKTVQWLVYKYLDLAGLESKHYSVHKLRHTAATLMYQSGNVDVRVLKDILGHEQLNTTQIYTHVSKEGMEKAMSQNPLAKVDKDKL